MNLTDYNEIRALLARHKFRFSKSMGQNFLTAAWVPEDIAASAVLSEEVGAFPCDALVLPMTEELGFAVAAATVLRRAGIRTQLYGEKKKFKGIL